MSTATVELMNRGIACLIDRLGIIETEQFLSILSREQFDYTQWQAEHFDSIEMKEMSQHIATYI